MSRYGSWGFICIIVAMALLGGIYITSQTRVLDSGISVYPTAKGTHRHRGEVNRDGNMTDLREHGKYHDGGILTGSVYNLNINSTLKRSGFPGEGTADGTVLVIKTHNAPKTDRKFDKCVMIYRNPKDAVLAEYKRKLTNHTGDLPKNIAVLGDTDESFKEVLRILNVWKRKNTAWLLKYTGPLHIVHYDDLKTGLVDELTAVLRFLDAEVTSQQMDCVVKHSEGLFHRKPRPVPIVFTRKILELMDKAVKEVDQCIQKRKRTGLYLSW